MKNGKHPVKTILLTAAILLVLTVGFFAARYGIQRYYQSAYPQKYSELVEKYADQYNVDKNLVYAVIRTESGFNPEAESHKDARGLMQIMDETYEWAKFRMKDKRDVTYDDMYDEELNIQYGTYILSLLLEEFKTQDTAVAAYHAGWGNVKKWLADPEKSQNGTDIDTIPFQDTDAYVKKVEHTKKISQALYGEQ